MIKPIDILRVLVIANGHPAPDVPHVYTFISEQAKALAEQVSINMIVPVEILLPISRHREQLKFSNQFPASLCSGGYVVYFPRAYRYFPGINKYLVDHLMLWATLQAIWRYRIKFDLIHAHFAHPSGYVAAMVSKIFKRPYILTVHGSDILEKYVDKKTVNRRKRNRNFGLRQADRVICVSHYLKKAIMNLGVPSEKIAVIPNGIDTKTFYLSSSPNGKSDIIFVGNFIERKGLDLLIKSFKKISMKSPDVNLKILGNGPIKSKIQLMVNELELNNRVKFMDQVSNTEIATIIQNSRLLCLPSREEGFGVVLIEALACGVPVVGARTGGIIDIIKSEEIGLLFEPGDANDLAFKLQYALDKKWNQDMIRQAGLKFSWDRIIDQIIEQYSIALGI